MRTENTNRIPDLETRLTAERPRLVRLCAHISGDANAAEDLAQETLVEAWRNVDRLREPHAFSNWLSGIARNVCRRWTRRQAREARQRMQANEPGEPAIDTIDSRLVSSVDLEIELEKDELAVLLDRALALLPDTTRDVLIQRYIAESSYAEIADRLGLNEGTVGVRLHRGRIALKQALGTHLRSDAEAYGLFISGDEEWQETRIWCYVCGKRQLYGRLDPSQGELALRCPECCRDPDEVVCDVAIPGLFDNLKRHKAALSRLLVGGAEYLPAMEAGVAPCLACGQLNPVSAGLLDSAPPVLQGRPGVQTYCSDCDRADQSRLSTLVLALPEGRRFWRDHPRIRVLPEQEIEANGRAALVIGYESVPDKTRLEAICLKDTYQLLSTHA